MQYLQKREAENEALWNGVRHFHTFIMDQCSVWWCDLSDYMVNDNHSVSITQTSVLMPNVSDLRYLFKKKRALENVALYEVCYFNYSEEGRSCEHASISENGPMKFRVCVAWNTSSVCQGECDRWLGCALRRIEFQSVLRCNLGALDTVLQKKRNVSPNSSSYWACVFLCLNFIFCYFLLVYNKFLTYYCELFFWEINSFNFITTDTRKHILNIIFLNSFLLLVLFLRLV